MDEMKTLRERDIELEKLWKQFEDLPMDPDTEKIEEPFLSFPAGTDREDIWHWFDERHSKGISYLLYGTPFYEKSGEDSYPLLGFIKQEVPFPSLSSARARSTGAWESSRGCDLWPSSASLTAPAGIPDATTTVRSTPRSLPPERSSSKNMRPRT